MRKIWLLGIAFFFIFLGFNGVQYHISSYFTEQGHPETGMYALMITYAAFGFFSLFTPWLMRYGLKRAMLSAVPLYCIMIISLGMGKWAVYIGSLIGGLGAAILWNAQISYLVQASNRADYGKNSGLFFTLLYLGSAIGVLLAGWLLQTTTYTFYAMSAMALIGFLFLVMLPELSHEMVQIRMFDVLKDSRIWSKLSVFLGTFFAMGISIGIMPLYIAKVIGEEYVSLTFIYFISAILVSFILGWLSDKLGRRVMIISASIAVAAGMALALFESAVLLVIGIILTSMLNAVLLPMGAAVVGDISTARNKNSISALLLLIENIGGAAAFFAAAYLEAGTVLIAGAVIIIITACITVKSISET